MSKKKKRAYVNCGQHAIELDGLPRIEPGHSFSYAFEPDQENHLLRAQAIAYDEPEQKKGR